MRGGSSVLQREQGNPGPPHHRAAIPDRDALAQIHFTRYSKARTCAGFVRCPVQGSRPSTSPPALLQHRGPDLAVCEAASGTHRVNLTGVRGHVP